MKIRDKLRAKTVRTNSETDWRNYRISRNKVTAKVKYNKKKYLDELYSKADKNKNVKDLYRITTEQLEWKIGGPHSH